MNHRTGGDSVPGGIDAFSAAIGALRADNAENKKTLSRMDDTLRDMSQTLAQMATLQGGLVDLRTKHGKLDDRVGILEKGRERAVGAKRAAAATSSS